MLILLSVCLMSQPGTCREERINWSYDGANAMACMVGAQQLIAQWHEAHQRWRVTSWRCTVSERIQSDI